MRRTDAELAADLAEEAGRLLIAVRDRVGHDFPPALGDAGDVHANDLLIRRLRAERPGDAVLSEEAHDDLTRLHADRVWIIDPLDGTREYSLPFRQDWAKKKNGEYAERADALLAQVGLKGFGDKRPWQLSGGMLQRASLCRALVHEPQLLLLDEPFGALDQFTREELWAILQSLWMKQRPTVLLVTHDLRESAFLANRIAVMSARPGRILEEREVPFARPRTLEMSYAPEFATLVQQLRMRLAHARTPVEGDAPEAAAASTDLTPVKAAA